MTHLLKVLTQIEQGDMQSLLCELPKGLLQDLEIQKDGTVKMDALLKICMRVKQAEALSEKGLKSKDKDQLHNLIFNKKIAANFNHKPKN